MTARRRIRFWRTPLLALVAGASLACSAEIGDSASGTGTGSGNDSTDPNARPIDETAIDGNSWYDTLKATTCPSAAEALPQSRIWRLNAQQWVNTAQQALGVSGVDVARFPKDEIDPRTGFSEDSTDSRVTLPLATLYFDLGGEVATKAAPAAIKAFSCLSTAPIDAACGQKFVADYGRRLFRRPLTNDETTTFATYLNGESKLDPSDVAVATVIRAMLLSPNFVYRTELGTSKPGQVQLTDYEVASLISYTIAGTPPDDQLLQSAAAGQLTDPAVREAAARRMVALPGARARLDDFWQQYLKLSEIAATDGIDAALGAAMVKETEVFFDKVVWDKRGSFRELLTAKYTYAEPNVAALYGTATPGADGRLDLTATQRSGFLTHASFLVGSSAPSQASTVIHRGLLVRERLLCEHAPPLPPNFVPDPAQIQQAGADATARENYDLFAKSMPSCNACHSSFQPLGLAFENYDKTGHYQKSYPSGKPVLPAGELSDAGDASGAYADVIEMASKIGASEISEYCFDKQFAQYAMGRIVNVEQEPCMVRTMRDHVTRNGGAVSELFISLAHVGSAYKRFHE